MKTLLLAALVALAPTATAQVAPVKEPPPTAAREAGKGCMGMHDKKGGKHRKEASKHEQHEKHGKHEMHEKHPQAADHGGMKKEMGCGEHGEGGKHSASAR